jgi:hypothetical protein
MKSPVYLLMAVAVLLIIAAPVLADETGPGETIKITSNAEGASVRLLDRDGNVVAESRITDGAAVFESHGNITYAEVSAQGYNTERRFVLMPGPDGFITEHIPLTESFPQERKLGIVVLLLLAFAGAAVLWDTRKDS